MSVIIRPVRRCAATSTLTRASPERVRAGTAPSSRAGSDRGARPVRPVSARPLHAGLAVRCRGGVLPAAEFRSGRLGMELEGERPVGEPKRLVLEQRAAGKPLRAIRNREGLTMGLGNHEFRRKEFQPRDGRLDRVIAELVLAVCRRADTGAKGMGDHLAAQAKSDRRQSARRATADPARLVLQGSHGQPHRGSTTVRRTARCRRPCHRARRVHRQRMAAASPRNSRVRPARRRHDPPASRLHA